MKSNTPFLKNRYLGGYLSTLEGQIKVYRTKFYYVFDGRLHRKHHETHPFESSSIVCDLRICDIRVCEDKNSAFRITTASGHSFRFSAPDANDATRWVLILSQQAKQSLLNYGITEIPQPVHDILYSNPECADCGRASPDWMSVNLGVMLCVECAFIHHSLGPHVSLPKCIVTSQECWTKTSLQVMRDLGNERSNQLWEHLASAKTKPVPTSLLQTKEQWIYAKYVCHHFIDRNLTQNLSDDPSKYIFNAASRGCNLDILRGLVGGGNVHWRTCNDAYSTLHIAAANGHLTTCHFLLQLQANPHLLNSNNNTPLDVTRDPAVEEYLRTAMQRRTSPSPHSGFVDLEGKHAI